MRTLHLTSPYMHGNDVQTLQVELIKDGYLKDKPDAVFGPLTAQGVYRAKYWLGYAQANLDQSAGDLLMSFLTGKKQQTSEMKARAAARKKQVLEVPLREKAYRWLAGHIGDKEHPPNSNRVSWASEWYGLIGPWCAMAVTRAYVEAGSKAFVRGQRYAYVPYIVNDAHAGRNNLALTKTPQQGDLVCFDWNSDRVADHIGLFNRWTDGAKTQFESVEGNTAPANDSNGGQVMLRNRARNLVQAFVHVGQ